MSYHIEQPSKLQRIALEYNEVDGLVLLLDGTIQFTERNEYRYHESLAVVPMLFGETKSILICGGGDGLAATRLLQYPEVESIVVCDYDKSVTDLASTNELLVELNGGSLLDERVKVVNGDAVAFVTDNHDTYDLIICDFPDPLNEALSDLYAREFYEVLAKRLNPGGRICVQTLMLPESRALIVNTIGAVFEHCKFYKTSFLTRGWSGYTIASAKPLENRRPCPDWTRYLDDPIIDTLFVIPKDERFETSEINTRQNKRLSRSSLLGLYYNDFTRPYIYNDEYRVIDLYGYVEAFEEYIPLFIRYCQDRQPLVIYLDRRQEEAFLPILSELNFTKKRSYCRMSYRFTEPNAKRLKELYHRLDNGDEYTVHNYTCLTAECPEVAEVFSEYLEKHSDRFLDVPMNQDPMSEMREHLVIRNQEGKIVLLMLVLLDSGIHVDVLYGRGSSRENMLGLLLCLEFIEANFGPRLSFDAATDNIIKFMTRLGADREFWMDTYVAPINDEDF